MKIEEIKEPSIVINEAIDIIKDVEYYTTKELARINELSIEEQKEIGYNYIIDICVSVKRYQTLIKDLRKIRDFASRQYMQIIAEEL